MKIVPFGKRKGQDNGLSVYSGLLEGIGISSEEEVGEEEDGTIETPMEALSPGRTKMDEVQEAIEGVVGNPSLDNLMIILGAIGMSKINMQVADDGSHLSVSGIISFSKPDEKISKKD
jgi:hypothetical protein